MKEGRVVRITPRSGLWLLDGSQHWGTQGNACLEGWRRMVTVSSGNVLLCVCVGHPSGGGQKTLRSARTEAGIGLRDGLGCLHPEVEKCGRGWGFSR